MKTLLRSIRLKLVSLALIVSGATLLTLSGILYAGIKHTQAEAFDQALHNHAVDVAAATDLTILGDLIVKRDVLVDEKKIFPFPLGQSVVQIRTLDGLVILSSRSLSTLRLPLSRQVIDQVMSHGNAFETIKTGGIDYRLVHYLIVRPQIPPLILQVAVPLTMLENERREIFSLFWILIPLGLLASGFGAFALARRALDPVDRIIKAAHAIQPGDLSARVPVPTETEMRHLALTLNELLARLETAFEGQEQFIADASHQLKTPLAIIRGEIDVFRKTPERSREESAALLTSVSQEVNQLSKMVDDLLLLARFDSGLSVPNFSRVRLDEAVLEAIAQLDRLARESQVELAFDIRGQAAEDDAAEFEVSGDFDLLRILFFNLIENSIKYSPKPGRTQVRVIAVDERQLAVEVEDSGPGIKPEDIGRIFDRFFRGGQRQHLVPGVGLGLSIAHRIAKFHHAELDVRSTPGQGAVFSFRINKF